MQLVPVAVLLAACRHPAEVPTQTTITAAILSALLVKLQLQILEAAAAVLGQTLLPETRPAGLVPLA
jgi:hypothetical protein